MNNRLRQIYTNKNRKESKAKQASWLAELSQVDRIKQYGRKSAIVNEEQLRIHQYRATRIAVIVAMQMFGPVGFVLLFQQC